MEDSIVSQATVSDLSKLMHWISGKLKSHQVPTHKSNHIRLALEEAIVNIIYHAYPFPPGLVEVQVNYKPDSRELEFKILDQGKPFDPLNYNVVDVSSDISERKPGGLGIYFMKKVSDHLSYERKDDSNILTICNEI